MYRSEARHARLHTVGQDSIPGLQAAEVKDEPEEMELAGDGEEAILPEPGRSFPRWYGRFASGMTPDC